MTTTIPKTTFSAAGSPPADRLGAVQVRWNDYRGTAAADDSVALLDSRSLYEIANLDRARWTIVGIDASLAATSEHVIVFAVDRAAEPNPGGSDPAEMGVTAFHLHPSTRVDQFLYEAFQRVSLRLISSLATDRALRVDRHIEQPAHPLQQELQ